MQYFKTAILRRKAEFNGLVMSANTVAPKRKKPINRLPIGYGLSALRLCVWLFYNRNIQILCGNKCFLLTLRTIQRKIYEYCISSDF